MISERFVRYYNNLGFKKLPGISLLHPSIPMMFVVLELRQRLSEQMSKTVIENQAAVRPVPGPACAGCGAEMRYKGMKENTVVSWVGKLKFNLGG